MTWMDSEGSPCRAQPDPRRPASKEVLGTLTVRMGEIYSVKAVRSGGHYFFFVRLTSWLLNNIHLDLSHPFIGTTL